nr:MAG TPA: hypothetical protein [Caudoviricetes sp.]
MCHCLAVELLKPVATDSQGHLSNVRLVHVVQVAIWGKPNV